MAGVITASVVSGFFANEAANTQADAAKSAANTSADAQRYASDLQYKMWQEQQALQKPWQEAGTGAVNRLAAGLAKGGEFATPFSQTNWQQDPGYAFRLAEGNRALNQAAAARGGLISGNALKAAERYGQQMGSQEYNNAFDRYYKERANMLTPLQSLANVGQTSAQSLGGQAGQYGANVGNLAMTNAANQGNALMAAGNARASSYGAMGSAFGQGLQGLYNNRNTIGNWFNNSGNGGYTNQVYDANGIPLTSTGEYGFGD